MQNELKYIFLLFHLVSLFISCDEQNPKKQNLQSAKNEFNQRITIDSTINSFAITPPLVLDTSSIESKLISSGLINIKIIDSTILVDLKYSTTENFLHTDMYGDFNKCYLQPDVAQKLKNAQTILRKKFPYYSLIIFDAVRPRTIQYKMWNAIDVPYFERSKYVSNPNNASLHNFGAAVDLSIADENGIELDMGTPYDYFGELAYPREEERLMNEGKLTMKQLLNRKILRDIMIQSDFIPITTEWWHFNSCTRIDAYDKYEIIE